jgi:hypothetical protein
MIRATFRLERSGLLDSPATSRACQKITDASRRNENVFGFSLSVAALEIEQFLRMAVPHPGHANIGAQTAHFLGPAGSLADNDERGCDPGWSVLRDDWQKATVSGLTGRAWTPPARLPTRGRGGRNRNREAPFQVAADACRKISSNACVNGAAFP